MKWRRLNIGFWIAVASLPLFAATLPKFKPFDLYHREAMSPEFPGRPTMADIKKMRKDHSISTLDGLLEKLKSEKRFQRLLQSPVLLFQSESLLKEFVSPEFPRAIFHTDGFLAALITNPHSGWAYETLEMAEFDPKTSRWRAERLTFSPSPSDLKSCDACHGNPYQPKWGSYGLWVGVTGGLFDLPSSGDITRLKNWRKSPHARLSWVAALYNEKHRPNTELTQHLSALNHRSMMQEFVDTGLFERYAHYLRGVADDCENIHDFFSAAEGVSQSVEPLEKKIDQSIEERFAEKKNLLRSEYRDRSNFEALATNFDSQRVRQLARLSAIMDISRWGLSEFPGENTYHFAQGNYGVVDFYKRELIPLYEKTFTKAKVDCAGLAEKSRQGQ